MDNPIALLAPLLFLIVFPLFWCAICLLLSFIGGWSRLASLYATDRVPQGKVFGWRSGMVGVVSYRNVLNVHVARDGLFLGVPWIFRVGHRPLFIPWAQIHSAAITQMLWLRQVRIGIEGSRSRVRLPAAVFETTEAGRAALERSGSPRA